MYLGTEVVEDQQVSPGVFSDDDEEGSLVHPSALARPGDLLQNSEAARLVHSRLREHTDVQLRHLEARANSS